MIAAVVLAGSPADALLCDCGEEIVQLYTFELFPGYVYYKIDGRLFECDYSSPQAMPVTRAEPIDGGAGGFNLTKTLDPVDGTFEFTAHAACDNCRSKRFLVQVVNGVVIAQD